MALSEKQKEEIARLRLEKSPLRVFFREFNPHESLSNNLLPGKEFARIPYSEGQKFNSER